MIRETASTTGTVVIVLDGDTDAGHRMVSNLLAGGRRVAVVARYAGDAVRVMHGQSADRVMVIAANIDDPRQCSRVTERVTERFGRVDAVLRAEDATLRASA